MKKIILTMLFCIVIVTTLCAFPVAAEDVTEAAETYEVIDAAIDPTLFTRIWEFVGQYPEETVTVVGTLTLAVMNFFIKKGNVKNSKDTKKLLDVAKETLGGQNAVVGVVNDMIEGYNGLAQKYEAMKEKYDLYGATEDERNRLVGAVLATNTAILEILATVYPNSKLPQGVKDIVNLKYANCLKMLDDDTQLRAIVEAVRSNIGNSEATGEAEAENTEV